MNRKRSPRRERRGFTLMEVLLVLAILVVLGSIAVGLFSSVQSSSNIKAAQVQVHAIDQASDRYRAMVNQYPTVLEDLQVMPSGLTQTQWSGPHIQEIPLDPWGNPYEYVYPGQNNAQYDKPDVWSYGPDGQSGTEDDIGNWPSQQL